MKTDAMANELKVLTHNFRVNVVFEKESVYSERRGLHSTVSGGIIELDYFIVVLVIVLLSTTIKVR